MKLYQHQQKLIDLNPKKYLLAWSCGSGKSLAAMILAEQNDQTQSRLLIFPKSLRDQWLENTIAPHSRNPMSWIMVSKEEFRKNWDKIPACNSICVDEAHFFSNYKSAMTKSLFAYIKKHNPQNIYLLSATPYLSSVWNIYTLGLILGRPWKWYQWNQMCFSQVKMGSRLIPIQKKKINGNPTTEWVAEVIRTLGNTVALEDIFDVPDQQYITEYFDLTAEQKKAIKELTDTTAIVLWTKTHQICGGTQKSDGYSPDAFYKCEKLNRLKELLAEHKKAIVVCRYNNELEYLKRELGYGSIINGAVKDKHSIIKEANASNKCLILAQAACSEGWEAPDIPVMIFYSLDFSLKNAIQMQGRIQRANNIKKNIYIYLVVADTIDNDVYKCIQKKKDFDIALYEKN